MTPRFAKARPARLNRNQLRPMAQLAAIILLAASAGMVATWRAPGLSLQARDALMRARGVLAAPDDIIILAIDEASIARFGRFPWPRILLAQTLDKVAVSQPRAIALNVLYSEPSNEKDDAALAESLTRAGKVVMAAQLIQAGADGRNAVWLRPLPAFEKAAAGIGHVNLALDRDGVARTLLLRQLDDAAQSFWAMAVETVRVGDGLSPAELREAPEMISIGSRVIPAEFETPGVAVQVGGSAAETVRAARLAIDYSGPAGAFGEQTISIADLLDGKIANERLRGKYVLIGATAAALGDRLVSPFTRMESADGNQNAVPLAGVEVLAHSVNTILRARFYGEFSDWQAFCLAGLMAGLMALALTLAQGRYAVLQQMAAVTALMLCLWFAAVFAFKHALLVLPVVPMFWAGAVTVPLLLLRRTLLASAQLDARLHELTEASTQILPSATLILPSQLRAQPATLIARLSGAQSVEILARKVSQSGYRLLSSHGASLARLDQGEFITLPDEPCASVTEALARPNVMPIHSFADSRKHSVTLRLEVSGDSLGALVVEFDAVYPPNAPTLQVCREIAANFVSLFLQDGNPATVRNWLLRWLPESLASKAQYLAQLQQHMLRRVGFVDRALHSVDDGLLVAGVDGFITFANPRAAQILGVGELALQGQDLFVLTGLTAPAREGNATDDLRALLASLLIERAPIEREITLGEAPPRFYHMRLAAVCENADQTGAVTGIVVTLSDVTRHRELQQMKNDVMALVTHELRTPLTAIQGISEVLAQHEFNAEEQREMHQAINEEAKRLARMIDEYLNIARLEAGAQPLRRENVRITTLLERTLLMLEPLARQRGTRLIRRFTPNIPLLLGDADLLSRAVSNLVTNALKYSQHDTEVIIETGTTEKELWIKVADQGAGIPKPELERIFEKFYRVARAEQSDAPGTGLGLPFVREVAELHGGRVTVISEVGVGSAFTLHLPLPQHLAGELA